MGGRRIAMDEEHQREDYEGERASATATHGEEGAHMLICV